MIKSKLLLAGLLIAAMFWACGPSDKGQGADTTNAADPATWTKTSEEAVQLLYQAQQKMGGVDATEVKALLQKILDDHPQTKQAAVAQRMLKELNAPAPEKDTIASDMPMPDWKEVQVVVAGSVNVNIGKVQMSSKWEHDRYAGKATIETPEAGYQWITADLSVVSSTPNPQLPPLAVYQWRGGQLQFVDMLSYLFTQWKSKEAYLGNQPDESNDFSKTPSTVSFRAGTAISDEDRKGYDLVVLVQRSNCVTRKDQQFDDPPFIYTNSPCRPKSVVSPQEIGTAYMVAKIFRQSGG